jgi:hypothetical protein
MIEKLSEPDCKTQKNALFWFYFKMGNFFPAQAANTVPLISTTK